MAVYTNNPEYSAALLPTYLARELEPIDSVPPAMGSLLSSVFGSQEGLMTASSGLPPWGAFLLTEYAAESQYDRLIRLIRANETIPDRTVCLAGAGRGFHGFKGRSWASPPGNLYLAVHLAPGRSIHRFGIAFTVLAALSVAEALSEIPDLTETPRIKWVNDLLLDGAKVGGVLAYTQSQGDSVASAVLGIGLNVETTPEVEPTPFVPRVAAVRDFLRDGANLQRRVLANLLGALNRNYETLLTDGISPLLERYRERSLVLGEEVTVCTEISDRSLQVVAQGRVVGLGENLELLLEDHPHPISGGRLAIGRLTPEIHGWTAEVESDTSAPAKTERAPASDGSPVR